MLLLFEIINRRYCAVNTVTDDDDNDVLLILLVRQQRWRRRKRVPSAWKYSTQPNRRWSNTHSASPSRRMTSRWRHGIPPGIPTSRTAAATWRRTEWMARRSTAATTPEPEVVLATRINRKLMFLMAELERHWSKEHLVTDILSRILTTLRRSVIFSSKWLSVHELGRACKFKTFSSLT